MTIRSIIVLLLAANAAAQQPDYRSQLLATHGSDAALQAVLAAFDPNLPILSWRPGDPNAWRVEIGSRTRNGQWSDPDGDTLKLIEVLAGPSPVEVSFDPQGSWALTMDIGPDWQGIVVRATDLPPPDAVLSPASRDVLTMVKGIRNEPPILY